MPQMWSARWLRVLAFRVRRFFRELRLPRYPNHPKGFVDPEQLREAQRVQGEMREFLRGGNSSVLQEREWLQAFARANGFPFIDLERTPPEDLAIHSIPEQTARRWRAMPIKRVDQKLWLAMATPLSVRAISELTKESGYRIIPVIAVPVEIDRAIEVYYSAERAGARTTDAD